MTVKEIITKYLKENGYDGLRHPDGECGCEINDLGPCDGTLDDCEPGYKTECDCGDHDYHISREREKPED